MISAIVLLLCFFCQVKGDTKLLSDDETYQNDSNNSASDSGDINVRGQYKLFVVYIKVSMFI